MIVKFVISVIIAAIFLVFIGFNLDNSCDISFIFTKIEGVPVYLTAFASFVLGLVCSIPITVSLRFRKKKAASSVIGAEKISVPGAEQGAAKPKKGAGKKSGAVPPNSPEDGPYGDDGSYGID
jgi:uncharacterized integral membrane protein